MTWVHLKFICKATSGVRGLKMAPLERESEGVFFKIVVMPVGLNFIGRLKF